MSTSLRNVAAASRNQVVLDLGKKHAWDSARLLSPDLVKVGRKYFLFYAGSSRLRGGFQIGLATSMDGQHFDRVSIVPILTRGPAKSYDAGSLLDGHVVRFKDRWFLYYNATDAEGKKQVAYAVSRDLVHWEKKGIVLHPTLTWEGTEIAPSFVGFFEGKIFLYYYAHDGWHTHVGLASSDDGVHFLKRKWPLFPAGKSGTWDAAGAEAIGLLRDPKTQEILRVNGYFYAFYDGCAKWKNKPLKWRIGIVRAPHPWGPWEKMAGPLLDWKPGAYGVAGPTGILEKNELRVYYESLNGKTNRIELKVAAKLEEIIPCKLR